MHRKVLIDWYSTSKGLVLQQQEAAFLTRSITVSCKQVIVQIGALGWENEFIDCSLYEQFYVMDDEQSPCSANSLLQGIADALPFKSESVDMVILPHVLDFDQHKHQVLREVERVLKPEGKLIILGFNPWNIYINLQYIRRREKSALWHPSLLSRRRLEDWLNLLNFDVELAAGFDFDAMRTSAGHAERRKKQITTVAYAIKAIKRCYHLIPLAPIKEYQSGVAMAKLIDFTVRQNECDESS